MLMKRGALIGYSRVFTRRHQTCHFRKRETSAYGLDFARYCEFPLRALQAQKWYVYGRHDMA